MRLRAAIFALALLAAAWADHARPLPGVVRADFGLTFFILYAAVLIAYILLAPKPKLEDARPAGLGDFHFPTATEGRVVPLIWGTVMVDGPNVIWYGDLYQEAIKEKIKTGIFSSEHVVKGFKYYVGIQFALCRGPITCLRGVWIGDTRVFDGVATQTTITITDLNLFGGNDVGQGGVSGNLSVFIGTGTQPVSTYLALHQDAGAGTNRTPRYTGLCYAVWERGYIGNSTNIKPWKFEVQRIPNGLALAAGLAFLNSGQDANPMNIAYDIMTDTEWGFAFPAADIDVANFTAAATTIAGENNGMSMILDRATTAAELLREVERQINGVFVLDKTTGKYKVKLIRDDYVIGSVPQLTIDTNTCELKSFSRGTWEDTVNQVRVQYFDRQMDYTERFAFAQDMANAQLQGGGSVTTGVNVSVQQSYPGVKDAALASNIVWRELRMLAYPLARGQLEVTRALWNVQEGDVLALTHSPLGLVQLPIRVIKVDHGNLRNNKLVIDFVQDVFKFAAASFGPPTQTGWNPPTDDLDPFTDVQVFEAPRGFVTRDPEATGLGDRIWAGAAREGNEVGFRIYTRISPAAYADTGTGYGTLYKATLTASLARGSSTAATFSITAATAADKAAILAAYTAGSSPSDIGTNLVNIVQVGNEFMFVTGMASGGGNDITLSGVYRGVLDSVQADHASSAPVWTLFVAGALTDADLTPGSTYDVKLLPFSRFDQVLESAVTAVPIAMSNRIRLPYPPGQLKLNTVADDVTSVSIEGTGSGDTLGILLDIVRRDYRTTDEVAALTVDAAVTFPDFPTLNTYEHQIEVRADPAGANTLLFTIPYASTASLAVLRNDILRFLDNTALPASLGFVIRARHTYDTVLRTALYDKPWAFTIASALFGQFNFGALAQNESSNLYTATVNGTYAFTVNSPPASGALEYSLNGAGFVNLITFPASTGNIAGVVATDTIRIRHTSAVGGLKTFVGMNAPGAGQDGYGILYV